MLKYFLVFPPYFTKQNFRVLYRIFIRSRIVFNPYMLFYIGRYYDGMINRDLIAVNDALVKVGSNNVVFYLRAHKAYYFGDYTDAIESLNKFLSYYPDHAESTYLLSKCFLKKGMHEEALELLYALMAKSKRKKTWLYLSKSLSTVEQFYKFDQVFQKMVPNGETADKALLSYYSDAAIKVGEYEKAINQWVNATTYVENNTIKIVEKKAIFSTKLAEKALIHLKDVLDNAGITFFLISGTLLGCIRDEAILPHDKDLDIGVWEDDLDFNHLIKMCEISGCFDIASSSEKLIKLKHINGTFIDVFIHYYHKNKICHNTSKVSWFNSHFELMQHEFLNLTFSIPKNHKKYLAENYGEDWKLPKVNFDSTFDTPNRRVISDGEMKVYLYRKFFESKLYD